MILHQYRTAAIPLDGRGRLALASTGAAADNSRGGSGQWGTATRLLRYRGINAIVKGVLPVLAFLLGAWQLAGGEPSLPASAAARKAADFQGTVRKITVPLRLRYRARPRTSFSMTQNMTLHLDGNPFSVRTTATGTSEVVPSGADLVASVTIDGAEVVYGTQRQNIDMGMRAAVRMSNRGEVREVISPGKDPNAAGQAKARQMLARVSKKMFPRFPDSGVKTGDRLLSFDVDLGAMAGLGAAMRGIGAGIVRGLAVYQGRQVVVVDLTLGIKTAGPGLNGSGSGYGLLDIETGAWLYTELSAGGEVEMEGLAMTFGMTEISKMGF